MFRMTGSGPSDRGASGGRDGYRQERKFIDSRLMIDKIDRSFILHLQVNACS